MHDVSKCSLQAIELSQSLSKLCTQTGRLSSSRTIQSAILACSSLTPVSRVSCFFFFIYFFLAVNECLTGLHRCSPHANCSDQRHGYHCACTLGFHGNGHVCRDINECFDPGDYPCSQFSGATCQNTLGSFQCRCEKGFTLNTTSARCENISDHCNKINHNCRPEARLWCKNTDNMDEYSCISKWPLLKQAQTHTHCAAEVNFLASSSV